MRAADGALPLPNADAQAHSARVVAHVRDAIDSDGGFISFERYMELVLYAPRLGYYVAGARRFGAAGDFVTGPEMTPLYGAALAAQVAAILATTQRGEVLELGAGTGALAGSLLDALAARNELPGRYRVLEVSPALRAEQKATLASIRGVDRVEWMDRLPPRINGVVVMNEVLDAVAPRIVARRNGRWLERGVCWRDDGLHWDERPLDDARVRSLAEARFPADGDYVSEVNPAAEALVTTIARRIGSGGMLVIDYGFPRHEYYHPQRSEGTLVGHYRHRVHSDPFLWPGLSDLTAHVDFTAIVDAGEKAGMTVAGFATQGSFLLGCGILDRLGEMGPPEGVDYLQAAAAVQKLTSPAEMGEVFKVLLLARDDFKWRSLAVTDMSHRL